MRIAQVNHKFYPHFGGIITLVKELCERLVAKGFEITVYTIDKDTRLPRKEWVNGILVKRYAPIFSDPLHLPPYSFLRDLRRTNTEIFHVHNVHSLLPLLVSFAKKSDQKLVLQPHYHRFGQTRIRNFFFNNLYKPLVSSLVFQRANIVIVNSSYEEKIVREDFVCKNNVFLVPEGLPLDELRSTQRLPERPDRILYVGSLRRYKNVDKLLKAFSLLIRNEKEIGFEGSKLVIVGNGREKRRLVRLAHEFNINDFIEWKDNLSRAQLLFEYARARVFVSLSFLESFGRATCEALAMGIPTVVPKIGVLADFVKRGLAIGLESVEPREVAAAILKARTSRRKFMKRLQFPFMSMDNYVDTIVKIYTQIGAQ